MPDTKSRVLELQARHLRAEIEPGGISRLIIDVEGSSVNILSLELLEEIDTALDALIAQPGLTGILLVSGKATGFGAGADIGWIARMQESASPREVFELLTDGKHVLDRLFECRLPTVAVIGPGDCLGGFAELALACQYRVAAYDKKRLASSTARIGLPEVNLGLLPGLGGVVRAYALMGLRPAIEFVTSGKPLDAARAYRKGLVDAICHPDRLVLEATRLAESRPARGAPPVAHRSMLAGLRDWFLENTNMGLEMFRRKARQAIELKTKGAYPAPPKILDVIIAAHKSGTSSAFQAESQAFAELAFTPAARNLVWMFLSRTAAQRTTVDATSRDGVKTVGVVGAGAMGTGIAWQAAFTGTNVILADTDPDSLARSVLRAWSLFKHRVDRGQLELEDAWQMYERLRFTLVLPDHQAATREKAVDRLEAALAREAGALAPESARQIYAAWIQASMARIELVVEFANLVDCDMIIEAVFENLEVKQDLVARVEEAMGDRPFFFATNTSSLKLSRIFEFSKHPERTLGLHFFNPVERMPVCEVVRGEHTAEETVAIGRAFIAGLKQAPIDSTDSNGFVVNRILGPYFTESTRLVWSGVSILDIDEAAERFGMPMGPLTLLDKVGHDIARFVFPVLEGAYGERLAEPPLFAAIEHLGMKGLKNGKGFYLYDERGRRRFDKKAKRHVLNPQVAGCIPASGMTMDEATLQDRLFLCMVAEAARCIEEGVASSPAELDLGMILGTGWAPGRGGPLHYADWLGIDVVVEKLSHLADVAGDNYTPCNLLIEMAASGRKFYS